MPNFNKIDPQIWDVVKTSSLNCKQKCLLWLNGQIPSDHLNDVQKQLELTSVSRAGFCGKGVNVAVIDTGCHSHLDFVLGNNRIIKFVDFVNCMDQAYELSVEHRVYFAPRFSDMHPEKCDECKQFSSLAQTCAAWLKEDDQ